MAVTSSVSESESLILLQTSTYEGFTSSFLVSSSALLIYDYCLTLGLECKLVWSHPSKWFSVLYLLQRYLPLIDTVVLLNIGFFSSGHSQKFCYHMLDSSLWLHIAGIALSEIILSLRIWALARDQFQHLAYLISASFVLVWGAISAMAVMFWSRRSFDSRPSLDPLARGCLHADSMVSFALFFGLVTLYELGGFALLVYSTISQYRNRKLSKLYNPVYRDGIFHYVLLFAMVGINLIVVTCISVGI
ncbi:hypothetical protein GYMLUDRAFT_40387 [Collybiopsis luxurians FD-317 M1]|uniref:DUF6533 domain-containing protein n=1 Tax=Collybiopsis luxurians FD-317 M1 TaxID=944289 RepID=A0A0D0CWD9_9AGAR|nr:hypothetical protein GYMLUDRAFT_40387 [Collybiopsis luxurians FD-317 M1]